MSCDIDWKIRVRDRGDLDKKIFLFLDRIIDIRSINLIIAFMILYGSINRISIYFFFFSYMEFERA